MRHSMLLPAVQVVPPTPLVRRAFFTPIWNRVGWQDADQATGDPEAGYIAATPGPFQGYLAVDGIGHNRAKNQFTYPMGEFAPQWLQGFAGWWGSRSKRVTESRPGATLPRGWALDSGDVLYGMRPTAWGLRRNIVKPETVNYGLIYED